MRKLILLIGLTFVVTISNSQTLIEKEVVLKWNDGNTNWITTDAYSHILTSGQAGSAYPFQSRGSLVFQARASDAADIVFGPGATPIVRMVIKGSGNVGIGTTNPEGNLDIKGNEFVIGGSGSNNDPIIRLFENRDSYNHLGGFIRFDGSNNYLRIGATGSDDVDDNFISIQRDNGNVGIGIDNPTVKLQVDGDISAAKKIGFNIQDAFDVSGNSVAHYGLSRISGTGYNNVALSGYYGLEFYTSGEQRIKVLSNGNVGIGATNPEGNLDIYGNEFVIGGSGSNNDPIIRLFENRDSYNHLGGFIRFDGSNNYLRIGATGSDDVDDDFISIQRDNGNVGIGTLNPQSKLAVNGTITSTEVVVTTDGWSDFVFTKDYKLPKLEEIENFIEENNHLPDIPSESEVKENGIALGEMNAKLLQKIEELTLYMIEMNKRVNSLETENLELKNKVEQLEIVE